MKSSKLFLVGGIILAVIIAAIFVVNKKSEPGQYDDFAKCLSDSGVKMYGAYWCSHCKNQKEMFGNSWKHINYIECSLPNNSGQTTDCKQAGITAYPTWEFQDGERAQGELSFEDLSQYSNCELGEQI